MGRCVLTNTTREGESEGGSEGDYGDYKWLPHSTIGCGLPAAHSVHVERCLEGTCNMHNQGACANTNTTSDKHGQVVTIMFISDASITLS